MLEQIDLEQRLKTAKVRTDCQFDQRVYRDVFQVMEQVDTSVAVDRGQRHSEIVLKRGWLAVSAVVLSIIVVTIWLNLGRAPAVFADVQAKVAEAGPVKYQFQHFESGMTFEIVADQHKGFQHNVIEPEEIDLRTVYSMERKEVLVLQSAVKQARIIEPTGQAAEMFVSMGDLLSQFQTLESQAESKLKEKMLNGRSVVGFRVLRPHPGDAVNSDPITHWTVWVDSESHLPVRIECASSWESDPSAVMSDFEFGTKVDESTFDTTPPAGWEVRREVISAPPEKRVMPDKQ